MQFSSLLRTTESQEGFHLRDPPKQACVTHLSGQPATQILAAATMLIHSPTGSLMLSLLAK